MTAGLLHNTARRRRRASCPAQGPAVTVATSGDSLHVAGLRFHGCPKRSLSVLLADGSSQAAETDLTR